MVRIYAGKRHPCDMGGPEVTPRAALIAEARNTKSPPTPAVLAARLLVDGCPAQAATVIRLMEVERMKAGATAEAAREAVDRDILEARWVG